METKVVDKRCATCVATEVLPYRWCTSCFGVVCEHTRWMYLGGVLCDKCFDAMNTDLIDVERIAGRTGAFISRRRHQAFIRVIMSIRRQGVPMNEATSLTMVYWQFYNFK